MSTTYGGDNITFPDGSTQNTSPQTGFVNRIINGAMTIDQRNAGASVTPSVLYSTYTLDRWQTAYSVGSKFSVQQNAGSVTPPAGFSNYLGATSLSAYSVGAADYFGLRQSIEGFNISDFAWGTANAQPITLSFWVRSSLTGTFGGALQNAAGNRFYAFSYTISASNTWEYKTVTIAGDTSGTWATNNTTGLSLTFGLGVGSTYSVAAGSWGSSGAISVTGATSVVGTSGATFYITGVQLQKGSTATPFEFRSIGQELALCQRYYQFSATSTPNLHGASYNTGVWIGNAYFQTTMRSAPVIANTGGTATVGTIGVNGFNFTRSSAECYIAGYTASAEL